MAKVAVLPQTAREPALPVQTAALDLAARLPHVTLEARRVMAAVAGVHGRRRAGPGEAFWQFRPFTSGEAASRIDWRRSSRDDRLYVREREWEAAHSVHLWIDRSPSMGFVSSLAQTSKAERALVLGLALADALVDAGEQVALLNLTPPRASHNIAERLADALLHDAGGQDLHLPPGGALPPQAEAVLITDALVPVDDFAARIAHLAGRGARGHVLRIVDPVEETFPFTGEAVLQEVGGARELRVGDTHNWGGQYRERFAAHGEAVAAACRGRGWSCSVHRTDRPASEAALRILLLMASGAAPRQAAGS